MAYIFFSRYLNITALKTDLYLLHGVEKAVKLWRVYVLSSLTELGIHFSPCKLTDLNLML